MGEHCSSYYSTARMGRVAAAWVGCVGQTVPAESTMPRPLAFEETEMLVSIDISIGLQVRWIVRRWIGKLMISICNQARKTH